MRPVTTSTSLAALVFLTTAAAAQVPAPPTGPVEVIHPPAWVQLVWGLEYDAEDPCPNEAAFRRAVDDSREPDPFQPAVRGSLPDGRVLVVMVRSSGISMATYVHLAEDGTLLQASTFWRLGATPRVCVAVMKDLVASLAVHIMKRRFAAARVLEARPAPPAPPPPPAPVPMALPLPVVLPPLAPPPKRAIAIHGGVDAVFNPVVAPSASLGFAPWAGVRLRDPAISIELGLRALWSVKATVASNGAAYRWAHASGVLAASLHKGYFFGGPVLEAGTLTPRTDQELRGKLAPVFLTVGLRAGVERSVADLFTLRVSIEGAYVPVGANLREPGHSGRLLWAMPAFSATVAAGVAFNLW